MVSLILGSSARMMVGTSTRLLVGVTAPRFTRGHHNDRWIVLSARTPCSEAYFPIRAASKRTESLRLAPSAVQPKGIPTLSVSTDHFHPSLARSVGFLPVPLPPQGLLCKLASRATSDRSRPMIRS